MCLQALEELVRPGMRVLDVGTGSGILAIAAAKLGAAAVYGVDTDRLAVEAATENGRLNGVEAQVTIKQGTLAAVNERGWDLVVVNILAPVIIELLQTGELLEYVGAGGRLILSGIIEEQADGVEEAVAAAGGKVEQSYTVRDWVALVVSLN
jgi:ribosomal protein L11 methyltransferase